MADNSTAVVFRDFRGTQGVIDDADPVPAAETFEQAAAAIRRDNSVNTSQALRTRREPEADEGAVAFGTPLRTGVSDAALDRQSTDSNN